MKKLVSIILASAMVLSLAACSTKKDTKRPDRIYNPMEYKPEGVDPVFIDETTVETEPTETSAAATTETTAEQTTATTSAQGFSFGKVSDYVYDARDDFKHLEIYGQYHVPRVLLNSDYAAEMQQEIDGCFAVYAEDIAEYDYSHYYATKYAAYLTEGGILTVVFVEMGEWDDDLYHVWNFDVVTGNKVDNRTIAAAAGVQDIRKAAMDAVQAAYNKTGYLTVENYEIVSSEFDYIETGVANSFSEERLNDDMLIGLRGDGSIFFITGIASIAGAEWYYHMIDAQGNDLFNDPAWVK
ncbi:MAG: hypothetical protein IKG01_09800 [Lachnospiraceae bacterium]|nr:hypothetical protein [Lachnospiraceae bacterium]